MDVVFVLIGVLCIILSFVGCVVPAIPGPFLAFVALLCLLPTTNSIGWESLVVSGVIMLIASVLDYLVPAFGAKKFKCSGSGVTGCMIGTVVGMFFMPIGLFLGPFLGAVVGELIVGRKVWGSVQGGFGALLGFLAGTAIKIVACGILATMFAIASCRGNASNGNETQASVDLCGGSQGTASPVITTAPTRVGLYYQFREGVTLKGMKDGDSKVGDGEAWTPKITVKGGNSSFYSIGVGKGE